MSLERIGSPSPSQKPTMQGHVSIKFKDNRYTIYTHAYAQAFFCLNQYDYYVCKGCYTVIQDMQIITNLYRNPDQPINVAETFFALLIHLFIEKIRVPWRRYPWERYSVCLVTGYPPSRVGDQREMEAALGGNLSCALPRALRKAFGRTKGGREQGARIT